MLAEIPIRTINPETPWFVPGIPILEPPPRRSVPAGLPETRRCFGRRLRAVSYLLDSYLLDSCVLDSYLLDSYLLDSYLLDSCVPSAACRQLHARQTGQIPAAPDLPSGFARARIRHSSRWPRIEAQAELVPAHQPDQRIGH